MTGQANDRDMHDPVASRVRRAVGFKVMRDLHREARDLEEERRRRPRLVALLIAAIVAVGVAAVLALRLWYR